MLRTVSSQRTEVDGKTIEAGEEAQVRPGTTVRLAQVTTLRFLGSEQAYSPRDAVTIQHGMEGRARRAATDDPDEISTAPPPLKTPRFSGRWEKVKTARRSPST